MPLSPIPLFDLQVNGFAGVDFQRVDLEPGELLWAVEALRQHGVGGILLTLISDEIDALCSKLARIESFRRADPRVARMVRGYHLEGPYLNPDDGFRGAHRADCQRAPQVAHLHRFVEASEGNVRMITLAPEWPGSPEFIEAAVIAGSVISLGHTNASDIQIDDAIRAGATLCTHLGNGVPHNLPRHDNVVQRLLARDELTACLIPDGVHLPPFVFKNFFNAKPAGKVILTTDAMAAAGAPPGFYTLSDIQVESVGGVALVPGSGFFAGSCLTADRGVENAAKWLGVSLAEARDLFSVAAMAPFGFDAES